jgi:hypothetical protein
MKSTSMSTSTANWISSIENPSSLPQVIEGQLERGAAIHLSEPVRGKTKSLLEKAPSKQDHPEKSKPPQLLRGPVGTSSQSHPDSCWLLQTLFVLAGHLKEPALKKLMPWLNYQYEISMRIVGARLTVAAAC